MEIFDKPTNIAETYGGVKQNNDNKMIFKYPKTPQLKDVVQQVMRQAQYAGKNEQGEPIYNMDVKYPTINFTGTVKMHGTHFDIIRTKLEDGTFKYTYQSRNNEITPQKDNAGCAAFFDAIPKVELDKLFDVFKGNEIVISGEFCGENIQKGVALEQLPKMAVIFAVFKDGVAYSFDSNFELEEYRVYNTNNVRFPMYEITIDFNNPQIAADAIEKIVDEIGTECPVGKAFGVIGTGEGVVWISKGREYVFKSKDGRHQVKGSTAKVAVFEDKTSLREFIKESVTENRLNQGVDYLKEMDFTTERKNIVTFLKWMVDDILTEEKNTITENAWTIPSVTSAIQEVSRKWYLNKF